MNSALRTLLLSAVAISSLPAANFAFTGLFLNDSDSRSFTFTTSGGTTIRTLSYGGGTNISGNIVSAGGFDPLLNIFDSLGNQVGSFDDSGGGNPCLGGITDGTQGCLDSYFNGPLGAGTYTLVLTQFDNILNGSTLTDGFLSSNACAAEFCDGLDQTTARSGNWAVDIVTADSAVEISGTPEPGTLALAGFGVLLCGLFSFRGRASFLTSRF
jgi:hypothetical protein